MSWNFIDFPPGEKSSGLLQNVAFLTEDLVLPAEPLQLGCHVLRSRLLWNIDRAVAIPGNPAGQRRQANTQIFSQFTPRPSAGPRQTHRLILKLLRKSLLLRHRVHLSSKENSPLFRGKSKNAKAFAWTKSQVYQKRL